MPSARTGQLVDYCSHFKLSGFAVVEHRHAGSWLGKEWPPGWLRETVVFFLSNLCLPNQGLEMQ